MLSHILLKGETYDLCIISQKASIQTWKLKYYQWENE